MQFCEFRRQQENGMHCGVAEAIAEGNPCAVTEQACHVCQACSEPMAPNRVTVSIAISNNLANKELCERIHDGYCDKLVHPDMMHLVNAYTRATIAWIKAGRPVRSKEEAEAVRAICHGCEHYASDIGSCKVCGCHVDAGSGWVSKTERATESCPLGKWGVAENNKAV